MIHYTIFCQHNDCKEKAVYKIAALWSDGQVKELKTYDLVCENCVAEAYQSSIERQKNIRRAPGEIAEKPQVYLLATGSRDKQLECVTAKLNLGN